VETSTVSKKGLTTIPSKIRQLMKIRTGDKLEWQVIKKEEGLLQIRVLQDPYAFLKGKRKDPNTTYEKVEHLADSIIEKEARREKYAHNRG
jgi:AbrB family looped-hinge helix DNA binding protein